MQFLSGSDFPMDDKKERKNERNTMQPNKWNSHWQGWDKITGNWTQFPLFLSKREKTVFRPHLPATFPQCGKERKLILVYNFEKL